MSDEQAGLYRKYEVTRTDGSSGEGEKHEDCVYFVLDIDHDPHALDALSAYALSCEETHPQLSDNLKKVVATRIAVEPQDIFYRLMAEGDEGFCR